MDLEVQPEGSKVLTLVDRQISDRGMSEWPLATSISPRKPSHCLTEIYKNHAMKLMLGG